jgi:hypothetical protein
MWHHRGKAGGAPPCTTLFFIRDLYHLYRSHKKTVSVRLVGSSSAACSGQEGAGSPQYPLIVFVSDA